MLFGMDLVGMNNLTSEQYELHRQHALNMNEVITSVWSFFHNANGG